MEYRFWLAQNFVQIARWLPKSLREVFGDELEDVLAEHLEEAAARGWLALLWAALHELLQLPGLYAREKAPQWARRGGRMQKPSIFDDLKESTPWGWALVGIIPFLFGPFTLLVQHLYWLAANAGVPLTGPFAVESLVIVYFVFIALIGAVLVLAWVKGFPAWSYGLGMIFVLISLYMTQVAIPGLRLFGHTFQSNELMGLRAWIPLGLVTLTALIITHKDIARPFAVGLTELRQDLTRVSFGLFGFTPFILMIFFDEMHGEELFLALTHLFLGACALVYLRARRVALGMGAMLGGLLLAYSASAVYLWWYWDGRVVPYLSEPIDGFQNMLGTLACTLPIIILTLGPWLIYRIARRRLHP